MVMHKILLERSVDASCTGPCSDRFLQTTLWGPATQLFEGTVLPVAGQDRGSPKLGTALQS
ncbi:hypothetical protein J6590_016623 [Homalodisca vitripennis]|nr:hypothetical protein J6590_016623 [Homalodisca vitripennis]